MRSRFILALAAGAALTAACHRETEVASNTNANETTTTAERRPAALVRMVQVIPEAPKSDVYANDKKTFTDVQFGQATEYKPIEGTEFKLALKPAGNDQAPAMIEAKEGVDPGRRYTILSMPALDGSAKIDVVTDEEPAPASEKAKLRIIHAAPETGAVKITAVDSKEAIVSSFDYGVSAGYREVDPGTIRVEVESKGRKNAALATQEVELQAGKLYTLIVAPGSEAGKPVEVVRLEDQAAGESLPTASGDNPGGKEKAISKEVIDEDYEIHLDSDDVPKDQPKGEKAGKK